MMKSILMAVLTTAFAPTFLKVSTVDALLLGRRRILLPENALVIASSVSAELLELTLQIRLLTDGQLLDNSEIHGWQRHLFSRNRKIVIRFKKIKSAHYRA